VGKRTFGIPQDGELGGEKFFPWSFKAFIQITPFKTNERSCPIFFDDTNIESQHRKVRKAE